MRPFSIYDQAMLKYWQTRYPENIRWNFENTILRNLISDELRILRTVKLEFPLEVIEGKKVVKILREKYRERI